MTGVPLHYKFPRVLSAGGQAEHFLILKRPQNFQIHPSLIFIYILYAVRERAVGGSFAAEKHTFSFTFFLQPLALMEK
jgi:hypothetical protein